MPPQPPLTSWRARIHSSARVRARRRSGFHGLRPTVCSVASRARKKLRQVSSAGLRGKPRAPPELVHGLGGIDGDVRPFRHQDGQRHDGLTRPARQRVDVDREPRRQQQQLDRHGRQPGPRKLAEVGEERAGEDTRFGEAAVREDELAGAAQRRLVGGEAGELECEVGLDRVAEMAGAAGPEWPAAIVRLGRQDVVDDAPVDARHLPAHEAVEEDVLRVHGDVRLQRRVPEALAVLLAQERRLAALDRGVEPRGEAVSAVCCCRAACAGRRLHGGPFSRVRCRW